MTMLLSVFSNKVAKEQFPVHQDISQATPDESEDPTGRSNGNKSWEK
jgi:hypothetical protein